MKNQVIKFFALCVIVCGLFANANAQQTPAAPSATPRGGGQMGKITPEQRVEARLNSMKSKLSLTDDQVAKVKPLVQEEMTVRMSHDQEAMKANHAKMESEMAKILTPEQMTKYKAIMGARMRPASAPQQEK